MEKIFDKMLAKLTNIEEKMDVFGIDLTETKKRVDYIYVRIDGFLGILNRHDAEIAALGSAQDRTERRLKLLESK